MSTSAAGQCVAVPACTSVTIDELVAVLDRTLAQGGLDRMTSGRIEEIVAVPALTAHI